MADEWAPIAGLGGRPVSMHDTGRTPDVRAGDDTFGAVEMPGVALILLLDGGAILEAWTVDADSFGDSWHDSVEEAKEVALATWGSELGEWNAIPADAADEVRYALDRRALSPAHQGTFPNAGPGSGKRELCCL